MSSNTVKLKPLFDRLVVRRRAAISKTEGGVLLPKIAQEQQIVGEVIAIGECRVDADGREHPLRVKLGDQVMWAPYCGTALPVGNPVIEVKEEGEVVLLREEELIGILLEDAQPATITEPTQCTEPVCTPP